MITDKDRELIKDICGCINIPIGISILNQNVVSAVFKSNAVGDIEQNELLDIISRIRTESADQARKDAAERAVRFFDDFRICVPPNKYNMPQETLEQLRAAIIGDSVIKENLTTDHKNDCAAYATEGKADAENLAIAVKALEEIQKRGTYNTLKGRALSGEMVDSKTIINEYGIIARDALKEIQG